MDYRSIPRIANSDLTEFKNKLLFGIEPTHHSTPAQTFGSRFHEFLLLDTQTEPTGTGATPIRRMLEVMRNHTLFSKLLAAGTAESANFWDDPQTGLACKARTDLRHTALGLIVEVKTTSATTQQDFLAQALRYEYDRQAAFYLDGWRMIDAATQTLLLIGIQKQKPHSVFIHEVDINSPFIADGRRKYQALLRSWKQRPYQPISWIGRQSGSDDGNQQLNQRDNILIIP